jgi:hypothetical protein
MTGIVHHDHTYTLPGECGECGGPGPGIPLVRGDFVRDLKTADGTLVATSGEVTWADEHKARVKLPDGREVIVPALPGAA